MDRRIAGANGYIRVEPFAVPAPVPNFTATPLSGPAPLKVNFTDTSTGNPTSWQWYFGDDSYTPERNPVHTYMTPGSYTVSHAATNAAGTSWVNRTAYVNVTGLAPVANFTAMPTSGNAPLSVQFTDVSTNSPTAWNWSFGDGSVSAAQNPSHSYANAGTYTVALNVSNAAGWDRMVKEGYVEVTDEPVALTYSMTNVELYNPDTLLDLAHPHINPTYTPGRAIFSNLSGRLQTEGWQLIFENNNAEVTKADFGTTGGGLNTVTFHYHFGHGNVTHALPMSGYISHCAGQPPICFDPSDSIHPSEMQWNGELKWIILDACSALENQDWAQPMGTTHGVLGFHSEKMPSQDLPNLFLQYALDEDQTVYLSYRDATYYSFTRNVTAAVIFSSYDQQQNDHFPGHGIVYSDETPNNHANDVHITWSCGGGPTEDQPYN